LRDRPWRLLLVSVGTTFRTDTEHPLYGFGNKRIEALGKIDVNVTFGQDATMRTEVITFDVVDFVYPYNAIFGRNTINKFAAVIHQG
jgi:hypothetical protein